MKENSSISEMKIQAKKYLSDHLLIPSSEIRDLYLENPQSLPDFEVAGKRYQVKFSSPVSVSKDKTRRVWDYDMRGNKWINNRNVKVRADQSNTDFYLLMGLNDDIVSKVFLIPKEDIEVSHVRISVSGKSKYFSYQIA